MEDNDLFKKYLNKKDIKYSVESAKTDILINIFKLKTILDSKQLKIFNKIEESLKIYEEIIFEDIFEFVNDYYAQKKH